MRDYHSWYAAIGAFTVALKAARRSSGTIRLYRHYLSALARTCADPWDVSTADLRGVLARGDWSAETAKSARTAYRAFYRWAHVDGLVTVNPAAALEAVRVPAATPRPAPETVVAQAVAHPDPRIARMAMLAAYCGLRAAEIAVVHSTDVSADLVGTTLRIHGKGGKVRTVPVMHAMLAGWLHSLDGYAFPSVSANGQIRDHLSPGHVSRLLAEALPDGWTAHTLRHRCATVAYAGTRDLLAVGTVLGHSRPETTQRYVRLPDDAARAAMRAAAAA